MNDPASISTVNTPLWDSLQRAVTRPFPTRAAHAQLIVGCTDARVYRQMGAIAYGAGLFARASTPESSARASTATTNASTSSRSRSPRTSGSTSPVTS